MLRKIFSAAVLAAAIFLAGSAYAATSVEMQEVAVVMEPPVETFDKPEEVHDSISQTVDKIFKYATNFSVESIDETAGYLQIYREENELEGAETFLKKSDIEKICQNLSKDFLIYLRVTGAAPKVTGLSDYIINGGSSDSAKVVLDFRVWSKEKGDFVYTKRITKTDYTLERGLKKCLQEIEKDAAKVRAAM